MVKSARPRFQIFDADNFIVCASIAMGIGVLALVLGGCSKPADTDPSITTVSQSTVPNDDSIRDELDGVLVWTFEHRHLNLSDHAAWQILHGALTYQRDFLVDKEGELVPAVDHVLNGGYMKGWTTEPGVVLDEESGQRGLRAILESGTKTGQGHADQWFAVLAQCGLEPTQPILVQGKEYTMQDLVSQVLWDIPRNVQREYSWTLIGLTTYLPTDHTWKAQDGQEWSIEKLVGIEAEQDVATSACGGTHRLIGMTMALNRHLENDGKIEGSWKDAEDVIQAAIIRARQYQNPDGSFSSNYLSRPGHTPDLAQVLGTTGHVLEFLTLAMTDEELKQPWVKRSVVHMCELFRKTQQIELECGALYHAAHGLALYRERMYGPRSYAKSTEVENAAKEVAAENKPPKTAVNTTEREQR